MLFSLIFALQVLASSLDFGDKTPPQGLSPQEQKTSELPFWKKKKDVYKRVIEDRYIVVSAKAEDVDSLKKLILITAGHIHAPIDYTYQQIKDYDSYSHFLPYIDVSTFDNATRNLFLKASLLGYEVLMTLHLEDEVIDEGKRINWRCISGSFVGMKGVFLFTPFDPEYTEISMNAEYIGEKIPIPQFILNWGLEMAGQRVAGSMRKRVEGNWEKSKKPKND